MGNGRTVTRWVVAGVLLLMSFVSAVAQENAPAPAEPAAAPPPVAGNDAFAAGKVLQPPHEKAALIRLDGPVDDMMLKSLRRRVDIARKAGCTLVIYEIDTYGGPAGNAIDISKFTKN